MAISSILSSLPAVPSAIPAAQTPASSVSGLPGDELTPSFPTARSTAETARTPPSREDVEGAIEKVQENLPPVARNLQFSLDEDTGHTVVKVIDTTTDEVIRQIPSEEFLAISKALDRFHGLLIKQKA
ncbi:MAG: flagellar protein FlaG [Candidatus Dactylopiibacterium sp.]|nr:flagellar protein FlaG [Candidatus Dactylopiibacterium sp.]